MLLNHETDASYYAKNDHNKWKSADLKTNWQEPILE